MLIHSKDYVTNLDEKCIQPNAVDIRVTTLKILDPNDQSSIVFSESLPKMFASRYPAPIQQDAQSGIMYWVIPPHAVVDYETNHETEVPEGYAGFINIRSTLARNGLINVNGIYDSGYKGMIGGFLHNNTSHTMLLEVGSRIAQYYMIKSESVGSYNGYYNETRGQIESNAS